MLNVGEADIQAGTGDACAVDRDHVIQHRRKDEYLVVARAAVNVDSCVHAVGINLIAVGVRRTRIQRRRFTHRGVNVEGVVPSIAIQVQYGGISEVVEIIVVVAAVERHHRMSIKHDKRVVTSIAINHNHRRDGRAGDGVNNDQLIVARTKRNIDSDDSGEIYRDWIKELQFVRPQPAVFTRRAAAVVHIHHIRAATGDVNDALDIIQHAAGVRRIARHGIQRAYRPRVRADVNRIGAGTGEEIFRCNRRIALEVDRVVMRGEPDIQRLDAVILNAVRAHAQTVQSCRRLRQCARRGIASVIHIHRVRALTVDNQQARNPCQNSTAHRRRVAGDVHRVRARAGLDGRNCGGVGATHVDCVPTRAERNIQCRQTAVGDAGGNHAKPGHCA